MSIAAAVPRIECVAFTVNEIKIKKSTAVFAEVNCAAARMTPLSIKYRHAATGARRPLNTTSET